MPRGAYFGACGPSIAGRFGSAGFAAAVGEVEPHEHDDLHFIQVLSGDYRTNATGADGCARAGSALAITPGSRHQDCFSGEGFLLTFTPCPHFLRTHDLAENEIGDARLMSGRAAALLQQAAHELNRRDWLSEFALETLSIELAALVKCAVRKVDERAPGWLARARERLEEDQPERLSIFSLAQEAGVHPVYFARKFRLHVGLAPAAAARRSRLKRAAQALLTTSRSLASIAADAGFADQPAFTKAFRRMFGCAPGVFRRRARLQADNTAAP